MKLSTFKRFGYTHVRGGNLVRVLHPHQVSARGMDTYWRARIAEKLQSGVPRDQVPQALPFVGDAARVVAGDLAIEVWNVANGKLLGYSYLTGEAVGCMHYETNRHDRYEPGKLAAFTIPTGDPKTEEEIAAFQQAFTIQVITAKWSDIDVNVVIDPGFSSEENARQCLNVLAHIYGSYTPNFEEMTDEAREQARDLEAKAVERGEVAAAGEIENAPKLEARGHIIGVFEIGTKKRGRNPAFGFHLQPPMHRSAFCSTPFQYTLLESAIAPSAMAA